MKFVTVELNYSGKQYEYQTELDLKVGGIYRLTTTGWNPPMRVRVVSISDVQNYPSVDTIISVEEAEEF